MLKTFQKDHSFVSLRSDPNFSVINFQRFLFRGPKVKFGAKIFVKKNFAWKLQRNWFVYVRDRQPFNNLYQRFHCFTFFNVASL